LISVLPFFFFLVFSSFAFCSLSMLVAMLLCIVCALTAPVHIKLTNDRVGELIFNGTKREGFLCVVVTSLKQPCYGTKALQLTDGHTANVELRSVGKAVTWMGEQAMKVFRLNGDEMELMWNNGGSTCTARKERVARDDITVSIQPSIRVANDTGPVKGEFTFTLSIAATVDVTVLFAVSGEAVEGVDFVNLAAYNVTIVAGNVSATIPVVPIRTCPQNSNFMRMTVTLRNTNDSTIYVSETDFASTLRIYHYPCVSTDTPNPTDTSLSTTSADTATVPFTTTTSSTTTVPETSAKIVTTAITTVPTPTIETTTSPAPPISVIIDATTPVASVTTPGVFTISLSREADKSVYLPYELSGTAVEGVDYDELEGIRISTHSLWKNIKIVPKRNCRWGNSTVVLRLIDAGDDAIVGAGNATVTILPNFESCPKVTIEASTPEANSTHVGGFTISLSGDAGEDPVSVMFALSGTAKEKLDFTEVQRPVVVHSDRPGKISIVPLPNCRERNQTVTLILDYIQGNATIGAPREATVTILSDLRACTTTSTIASDTSTELSTAPLTSTVLETTTSIASTDPATTGPSSIDLAELDYLFVPLEKATGTLKSVVCGGWCSVEAAASGVLVIAGTESVNVHVGGSNLCWNCSSEAFRVSATEFEVRVGKNDVALIDTAGNVGVTVVVLEPMFGSAEVDLVDNNPWHYIKFGRPDDIVGESLVYVVATAEGVKDADEPLAKLHLYVSYKLPVRRGLQIESIVADLRRETVSQGGVIVDPTSNEVLIACHNDLYTQEGVRVKLRAGWVNVRVFFMFLCFFGFSHVVLQCDRLNISETSRTQVTVKVESWGFLRIVVSWRKKNFFPL
jgi:hypothetical protein